MKDYIDERAEAEIVSREEADRRTWIDVHGPLIGHAAAVQESRFVSPPVENRSPTVRVFRGGRSVWVVERGQETDYVESLTLRDARFVVDPAMQRVAREHPGGATLHAWVEGEPDAPWIGDTPATEVVYRVQEHTPSSAAPTAPGSTPPASPCSRPPETCSLRSDLTKNCINSHTCTNIVD